MYRIRSFDRFFDFTRHFVKRYGMEKTLLGVPAHKVLEENYRILSELEQIKKDELIDREERVADANEDERQYRISQDYL